MAYKHLNTLSNSPYYDDFDATKNFLQVLFRPGYAVQARELTQLQTILQNQISKVGDHLFIDGTHVYGAKISSSTYYFARIPAANVTNLAGTPITGITANTFKNKCFCPSQIKFKGDGTVYNTRKTLIPAATDIDRLEKDLQIEIVDVLDATASDDWILIFKINKGSFEILDNNSSTGVDYTTSLIFTEITTDPSGGNVTALNTFSTVKNTNNSPIKIAFRQRTTSGSNILIENTNEVTCVGISSGIFYKDGRFIQTPDTFIPLYKLSEKIASNVEIEATMADSSITFGYNSSYENRKLFSYPSKKVGFEITYSAITDVQDATLLDNAQGSSNYNAPGAARLKATVSVISEKFDPNDPESYKSKTIAGNDFIELVRYKKGVIQTVKQETEYNEILKLFAGRTYDESGSYTVNPFKIEIKEHLKRDLYKITFSTAPTTTTAGILPEVGDMIFKTLPSSPSTRLVDLIFLSQSKTGSQKYPNDISYTEPIGVITRIENTEIYVEMLNSYSFTGLASGTSLSIKSSDNGSFYNITPVAQSSVFIPDINGLYSLGDTPIGDEDKAALLINSGKGYVEGFKVENFNSSIIDLPKARSVDHRIEDVSTVDFTKLENVIYMEANNQFIDSTVPITDTYININADTSLVAMYFAGPTQNDYADAEVLSWTPFEQGNLINLNTSNSILPLLNKQSVLFITPENEPIIPED